MLPEIHKISFVIPCYGSEHTLESVVEEIRTTMGQRPALSFEILLVSDHSPDGVYAVIRRMASADSRIHGYCLARNFGQHAALLAGLSHTTGDVAVCLDDDGQTPANESLKLVDALSETVDVAYASYKWAHKQHSRFRNFGSVVNGWMLRALLGKPAELEITSFFAVKRYVVEEICRYQNSYPYVMGLVLRTTHNIVNVPVMHRSRASGQSGYTFKKLLALWLNGFTAFSVLPLRMATWLGVGCAGAGFLYIIYLIIRKLVDASVPLGYSSLMAMLLFIGGILMLMLGMLGEYIGRMYICLNKNPQYVISDETDKHLSTQRRDG